MTAANDNPAGRPARRLRIDEFAPSRMAAGWTDPSLPSGRRVIIVCVAVLILLWGVLAIAFRDWRARYRERAAFGARQVAPEIDPLAAVVPAGVEPKAWRQAVAETHAMLVTLTASNLLDRAQMRALRADVIARVARVRAHPETARAELARLWDELTDRAEPIIENRHTRPKLLPPRVRNQARQPRSS